MKIQRRSFASVTTLQAVFLLAVAAQDQRATLPKPDIANVSYGPQDRA
jgi:hypothetical protein